MSNVTMIGLDLAKNLFQVHGADEAGRPVLRKRLRRSQLLPFFGGLAPCLVAMEACSGAHHFAREIQDLGHKVRLNPPQYVKPFVKTNQRGQSKSI
ncbi:Putative transposase (fragment) [Magnetospira sp. QH-2]